MHFFTKILFINCLLLRTLHGMGTDHEIQGLITKLGQFSISWEDKKAAIKELMTTHGMSPNAIRYGFDNEGRPLHNAVYNNDLEFVQFLLKSGADINLLSYDGLHEGPILFSVGSTQMAQLLLDSKALINAKGGKHYSIPLLCSHSVLLFSKSAELITFYGEHGVDACAVDDKGATPLHRLIFGTDSYTNRLEKAKKLIGVGVSLDPEAADEVWGTMTFVQRLKVKIKLNKNEKDRELLQAVQKAVIARNARAFEEVHRVLSADTTGVVISYYEDHEKFDQTDKEIDKLAQQIETNREENKRKHIAECRSMCICNDLDVL